MQKIDAHIHFAGDHLECLNLLDNLNIKLLNICVAHENGNGWRSQATCYSDLAEATPQHFSWCTSIDLPRFDNPDYAERVISELDQDFAAGAIACKIWKNIGMEVKKPSGEFIMIDDPLFDPIYMYLAKQERPLLLHIGEPLACWQPLDENNPHYNYYSRYPQWHMYNNQPEYPSHQALIDARDNMVAKHPKLKVIGAHLGSLEYDVAEVAKRLDRYPNFAVDTSARMPDLTYQDSATVRHFFEDYPGRILFGTDMVFQQPFSGLSANERQSALNTVEERYAEHFGYFESRQMVTVGNRQVQGLGLSAEILEKFYQNNAQQWYPGL